MTVPVREGEVVGGKDRVERVLGIGGMGVVVAARHEELARPVALKLMLPKALQRPGARERFLREARAAVRLRGEHVAQAFDVGALENGAPVIVTECLEGKDLQSRVETAGKLPVAEAVDLVLQACEALAEAHAVGIVHRDLEPDNLFLTEAPDGGPLVKVLDFGISKWKSEADKTLTGGASVMGSPAYMSPEQMRSTRDVDVRTDIWSLGVILHQLVSGRLPFEADSVPELFALVSRIPAPALVEPDVPPGFDAVVRRCLERDRSARFADVADLAAALAPFGGDGARDQATRVGDVLNATRKSTRPAGSDAQSEADVRPVPRLSPEQTTAAGSASALPGASPEQARIAQTRATAAEPLPSTRIAARSHGRRPFVVLFVLGALLALAIGGAVVVIRTDGAAHPRSGPRTRAAIEARGDQPTAEKRTESRPAGAESGETAHGTDPVSGGATQVGRPQVGESAAVPPQSTPRRTKVKAPTSDDDDVFRTRR